MKRHPIPSTVGLRGPSWLLLVGAMAAALVVLPLRPVGAAELPAGAPTISGCDLTIPNSDGVLYLIDADPGRQINPGTHSLLALADEYPTIVVAPVPADDGDELDADVPDQWALEFPLECGVTVQVACEAFTVTDHIGWGSVRFQYTPEGLGQQNVEPEDLALGTITIDVPAGHLLVLVQDTEMQREFGRELVVPECTSDGRSGTRTPTGAPAAGR